MHIDFGFDFDGVYVDSHRLKPLLAKEMYGVDIPEEHFQRSWVLNQGLLTPEQYDRVGQEVFSGKHPLVPVPGALEYTNLLLGEGYTLAIITSRIGITLEPALVWKSENQLAIPIRGVGYKTSKADACTGLRMYTDDDLTKLEPLIGVVSHLLLFSRPENSQEKEPAGIQRVGSWKEIYEYIHRMDG